MKKFVAALTLMTISFALNLSLSSIASAQVKIEMPDPSQGYTVCEIEGMNKVGTLDKVDSGNPKDYETYGTSAAKTLKNDKLQVFVEISEDYHSSNITFHVESLVTKKTIASNVTSMMRGGFYNNTIEKPSDHFQSGEYQFVRVVCGKKR